VATAVEKALQLAACRLPESEIIKKSGFQRNAVRKQLARLIRLGRVTHYGKRGGYSPASNSEEKP
jgi:DNA-binding IclR family transcriptional regulator